MVNVGPLTAEIYWRVWGTPANFNGFRVLAAYVTARHSSSGRQPNCEALNTGRHLYSAGRPSRWALAHILLELFSLALTVETLQAEICRCERFFGRGRSLRSSTKGGVG